MVIYLGRYAHGCRGDCNDALMSTIEEVRDAMIEWEAKNTTHLSRLQQVFVKMTVSSIAIGELVRACYPQLDPILQAKYDPLITDHDEIITELQEALLNWAKDFSDIEKVFHDAIDVMGLE